MFTLQRIHLIFSLIVFLLVPLGLATKIYHGPGEIWVINFAGGILYEMFFCLLPLVFFPALSPFRISVSVLTVTCVLEAAQLWHPPFLEQVRSTFIGRTLIGTTFSWLDFPHYILGCLLGYILIRMVQSRFLPLVKAGSDMKKRTR